MNGWGFLEIVIIIGAVTVLIAILISMKYKK
jgi:hypothetical protein